MFSLMQNLCETLIFGFRRKPGKGSLPTLILTFRYSCIWMCYSFVRQETSRKISRNLYVMKISHFTVQN